MKMYPHLKVTTIKLSAYPFKNWLYDYKTFWFLLYTDGKLETQFCTFALTLDNLPYNAHRAKLLLIY